MQGNEAYHKITHPWISTREHHQDNGIIYNMQELFATDAPEPSGRGKGAPKLQPMHDEYQL